MGVRGPPLHRSRAWVSCFHPWLQLSASLVCARGTYFTSAHPQLNLIKLLTANCWGTWGSDLGDPDWSNESSLSRGNAQVWISVPSNFLPCVFCRRYYSPDHPCSTSIGFCSSWAIFRIKPAHSFWEETGCGYIDYCPGSCNAVFTLLQALWTEETGGCQMAKRSGLGQVMCWRFSQSSLSGDSHGQSQCRPPVVRRPKVPPQRDELQQQINSEYTDNSHGTHIIMRRCFSFSCECPRSNVSWPGVPGPFKAKSFLKHPYGIRGLGGKDRHN